jgi:hypothetical protein
MALEKGDRVIFTKNVGGILWPHVSKGTEATMTKPEDGDPTSRSH